MSSSKCTASFVALLSVVLLPSASLAADLPVTYEVDEKVLKTDASAGTSLTFELHGDSGCGDAVASSVIPIEDLSIDRLKKFKVKGGEKPPKAAILKTTLTGVTPPVGGVYLKVIGDGITAIGSDCQAQWHELVGDSFSCLSEAGTDVIVEGCNLHVRNDSGSTGGAPDGLGNVIVGHAENSYSATRTGSHNLIVGSEHEWTSYGGLLVGRRNTVSGAWASVSGGYYNTASGYESSVSGGYANTASGNNSSVSGGYYNTASSNYSSVSGGRSNSASGYGASVSGGRFGTASGDCSSVSGGRQNSTTNADSSVTGGRFNTASGWTASVSGGKSNIASGYYSSVSGGSNNMASQQHSSVSGGWKNTASGSESSVSGGSYNTASTGMSSVSGGKSNIASAFHSSVSGGESNTASGYYSSVSGGDGRTAAAAHDWVAGTAFEDN